MDVAWSFISGRDSKQHGLGGGARGEINTLELRTSGDVKKVFDKWHPNKMHERDDAPATAQGYMMGGLSGPCIRKSGGPVIKNSVHFKEEVGKKHPKLPENIQMGNLWLTL